MFFMQPSTIMGGQGGDASVLPALVRLLGSIGAAAGEGGGPGDIRRGFAAGYGVPTKDLPAPPWELSRTADVGRQALSGGLSLIPKVGPLLAAGASGIGAAHKAGAAGDYLNELRKADPSLRGTGIKAEMPKVTKEDKARIATPGIVGSAIGFAIGGPLGAGIGGMLGDFAGKALGLGDDSGEQKRAEEKLRKKLQAHAEGEQRVARGRAELAEQGAGFAQPQDPFAGAMPGPGTLDRNLLSWLQQIGA